MNAEQFLNEALGGNMNLSTLKPLAWYEIMEQYARHHTEEALKTAQNNTRADICPHAKVLYTTCRCEKSGIEAHEKRCDGKGTYIVIGNMAYEYHYQCKSAEGQTSPVV